MKITNPTKNKIEGIKIGENTYSIDAEGTLNNVPEKDARYWQENLHKFLVLKKDSLEEVSKKEVVEIPTPVIPAVTETVSEEIIKEEESPVVAENPKSAGLSKTVK